MGTDADLYQELGKVQGKIEGFEDSFKVLFTKIDTITDKLNTITHAHAAALVADQKAEKAHSRIDEIAEDINAIKLRGYVLLGGTGTGSGLLGAFVHGLLKKWGYI